VHVGLLPPRQELIEGVDAWLDDLLASVPRLHAQLVRPFARWRLTRGSPAAAPSGIPSAISWPGRAGTT
jgi:hypothetical protein